ncbi:phosphoribosylanthranilate isomerase [Sporolituus thermophilus]|uniref:phosphoribosylanthranilate isomerase n=1 Tax=Sporolituus thermophilus TaxID=608505 RepID=UPI000B847A7C|nr:phosphoribosylanthranilate isomerase [Sporolituus thermophilus]
MTSLAAAQAAKEGGADLLGFVFADSRRRIELQAAQKITRTVKGIGKVGVFVNAPLAEVQAIASQCRLDFIQLHGDETPAYCRAVKHPVIKAVRIRGGFNITAIEAYDVEWVLFDSLVPGQYGGTGVAFAWHEAQPLRWQLKKRVMVAGGLTPENVGEAIRILRPDGVDVSGGVETGGNKDSEKIYRFIQTVRAAQRGGGNAENHFS